MEWFRLDATLKTIQCQPLPWHTFPEKLWLPLDLWKHPKARLARVWSNLEHLVLLCGRGWNEMGFRVSSPPNHSMILWTGMPLGQAGITSPQLPGCGRATTTLDLGHLETQSIGRPSGKRLSQLLPSQGFCFQRKGLKFCPGEMQKLQHQEKNGDYSIPHVGMAFFLTQKQRKDRAAPWKHCKSKKEVSVKATALG